MSEISSSPSNYYRPPTGFGAGPTPPGPAAVSFESMGTAWKMISSDWGLWLPVSLLSLAILVAIYLPSNIVIQIMAFSSAASNPGSGDITLEELAIIYAIAIPTAILVTAVAYMCVGAMMNMAYMKLAGQPVTVTDLFTSMRRFFPLLGVCLIYSLAVTIGSFFCAVPGLIAMGVFAFAPLLVIREGMGAWQAMMASVEILKKDWLLMCALTLVLSIVASLGSCACLVGLIFTWPLYPVALAVNYYNFRPPVGGESLSL